MSDTTLTPQPAGKPTGTAGLGEAEAQRDVSKRKDVHMLAGGAVGLGGVLFLTVTGSAPISAMLFNTPLAIGFGNGNYAPAGFIFAAVILAIFSVGYVAMARKVTAAGGFYSFISQGLGRELGLASGISLVAAYSVFEASLCGGFAFFLQAKLASAGWNISWVFPALFMVVLIGVLCYFHIHLSARILGVALICEVVALLVFDGVVFAGNNHVSASSLNVFKAFNSFPGGSFSGHTLAAGAAAIGIFYAFWSWVGFEMAPNYGEESRNPKRNVPAALYISVIGLGVFYALTCWAVLGSYSSVDHAAYTAQNHALEFFFIPAESYSGNFLREVLSWLIITGSFACGMAFHNTTARYFYSLGRERVLPSFLGRTHPRWQSPHTASIVQSCIAAIIVLCFAVGAGTGDPEKQAYIQLYGLMAFMGVVIILAVQAIVSVAIWNYFRTHHRDEHHFIRTFVCPLIGFVAQGAVLYLAIKEREFIGSHYTYTTYLVFADLFIFVAALAYAFWLKSNDSGRFDQVGRLINRGLDGASETPAVQRETLSEGGLV
jgi:amino acid transporter